MKIRNYMFLIISLLFISPSVAEDEEIAKLMQRLNNSGLTVFAGYEQVRLDPTHVDDYWAKLLNLAKEMIQIQEEATRLMTAQKMEQFFHRCQLTEVLAYEHAYSDLIETIQNRNLRRIPAEDMNETEIAAEVISILSDYPNYLYAEQKRKLFMDLDFTFNRFVKSPNEADQKWLRVNFADYAMNFEYMHANISELMTNLSAEAYKNNTFLPLVSERDLRGITYETGMLANLTSVYLDKVNQIQLRTVHNFAITLTLSFPLLLILSTILVLFQ